MCECVIASVAFPESISAGGYFRHGSPLRFIFDIFSSPPPSRHLLLGVVVAAAVAAAVVVAVAVAVAAPQLDGGNSFPRRLRVSAHLKTTAAWK